MKKRFVITLSFLFGLCMISGAAFAQSSGNFNAAGTGAACAIGTGGSFSGGAGVSLLTTNIQTSNGNGVTLLMRPSLVTGLFTDTKINTNVSSASADVGIRVCVTVDGSGDNVLPVSCAVYDQRFQQISSNLFSQLTECTQVPSATVCSTDADCTDPAYPTCSGGVCVGTNPNCNFDLILSTLSAHSFDFVAQVPGGSHTVQATWSTIGQTSNNANSNVASCVGPGILTVTQTKVFKQDGSLSF